MSSELILPEHYDKSIIAVPWTDIEPNIINPVRNTKHEYLHFVNSEVFSEDARRYLRYGYYTNAPIGTKDYEDYWDEQERRCLHGYSVGGVRITGRHYFYLNFCQIKARPIDPNTGKENETKKIITFPRFLDHNYYFFHEVEECFAEGEYEGNPMHGMVVLKSRRKGHTYLVTGGIYNYNYQFVPASMNILAAYLKTHYKVTLDGIHFSVNHINKATAWAKRKDVLKQKDHFRASLLYTNDAGMSIEDGYMSEINAISFKDDPFKSIGESCYFLGFEEAGKFEHLLTAYSIAEPTLRDGDIFTGVPMFWGCLTANNKVWTSDGNLINVDKINKNDGIIGYKNDGAFQDTIEHINPPSIKPCYKITTNTGNVIECSEDHPILWSKNHHVYSERKTENGKRVHLKSLKRVEFKEAKDICIGDQLSIIDSVPIFNNKPFWESRFVGMLIGDGSYGINKTPILSNADDEINSFIKEKYDIVVEREHITKDGRVYKETRIKGITKNLRNLGIYGQTKLNKRLPHDIFLASKKDVCDLIAGFFDTDGNVVAHKDQMSINLTSSSKDLLIDVKNLCVKIGVHGSISYIKPRPNRTSGFGDKNGCYRFTIADVLSLYNFYNNITLLVKEKQLRLSHIPEYIKSKKHTSTAVFTSKREDNKNFVDINKITGVRFETVKNIEFIGDQIIYNLSTKFSHTYLANNIITHNTGGDIEKGSADLAELFFKPEAYGCKSYENIYEENTTGNCGWFIDDMWYYPGETEKNGKKYPFVDVNGNSYRDLAEESLDVKRALKATGNKHAYHKFVTQQCKTPSEALMRVQGSNFDTFRCNSRLYEIESQPSKFIDSIWFAKLDIDSTTGKVVFRFDNDATPLLEFPIKDNNRKGAIEIYEMPVMDVYGNVPSGRYLGAIDPYDDDVSTTNSVGSLLILDGLTDRIVCHYKGRPEANTFYENCRRILKFYNAVANYERNKKMLYGYFYNKKSLNLLVDEPEILREKGISKSNIIGNNRKGTMGSTPVNNYGLELSAIWSASPAYNVEEGSEIINIDKIRSRPLLKEMIGWNPDGNFDDISALGMLMILREDRLNFTKPLTTQSNIDRIGRSGFWLNVKQKRINKNGIYNGSGILSQAKNRYIKEKSQMG